MDTVLIVEDDEKNRLTYQTWFEDDGYKVTLMGDPDSAISFLKSDPNARDVFAIVTDFRMPGMNGYQFLQEARALGIDAYTVMVTAYSEDEGVKREARCPEGATIEMKPISRKTLMSQVKQGIKKVKEVRQYRTFMRFTGGDLTGADCLDVVRSALVSSFDFIEDMKTYTRNNGSLNAFPSHSRIDVDSPNLNATERLAIDAYKSGETRYNNGRANGRAMYFLPVGEGGERALLEVTLARPITTEREEEVIKFAGRLAYAVGKFADTQRELQQTREHLIHSEKMAAIGTLAEGVAHEFNNLLCGIYGYAQFALSNLSPEPTKKYLEKIVTTTRRATDIVTKLGRFAKDSTSEERSADVEEIINDVIAVLQNELKRRNIRVETLFADIPMVKAKPGELQHVFMNMVMNAIQSIDDKLSSNLEGEPEYSPDLSTDRADPSGRETPNEIVIRATPENDSFITVTISDTGSGIPAEHISQIFDPFFTTKGPLRSGSYRHAKGLGLFVADRIIEKTGGKIHVESKEDGGTVFFVTIPALPQANGCPGGHAPDIAEPVASK